MDIWQFFLVTLIYLTSELRTRHVFHFQSESIRIELKFVTETDQQSIIPVKLRIAMRIILLLCLLSASFSVGFKNLLIQKEEGDFQVTQSFLKTCSLPKKIVNFRIAPTSRTWVVNGETDKVFCATIPSSFYPNISLIFSFQHCETVLDDVWEEKCETVYTDRFDSCSFLVLTNGKRFRIILSSTEQLLP